MSINIQLNDEYRLTSDKRQWIIQKKGSKKDKETGENLTVWRDQTYHPTPTKAVQHYSGMRIRTSEADTLTQALKNVESIVCELTRALTPYYEIEIIQRDVKKHHWTE